VSRMKRYRTPRGGATFGIWTPYRPTPAPLSLGIGQTVPMEFSMPGTIQEARAMPSIHHWASWHGAPGRVIDTAAAIIGGSRLWPVASADGRYVLEWRVEWKDGGELSMRGRFSTLHMANLAALLWLQNLTPMLRRGKSRKFHEQHLSVTDKGEVKHDVVHEKLYPAQQTQPGAS
jgi:hypothetical protein